MFHLTQTARNVHANLIPLSGTGDDCTEPVSGGQQHEESHDDSISRGDAFECRIGIRRSGFHWNQNRTSAGASGGSRYADAAGIRFHLGCGLLVSRRKPLQMARRLLDPSTVRQRSMDLATSRRTDVL